MNTEQKWPNNLVIVRHAESERNKRKEAIQDTEELRFCTGVRDMDVPLTSMGERQSSETGRYLASRFKFDAVFASPFKRTQDTARLILAQFPSAPEVISEERIREIEFGVLDGVSKHGIRTLYPEEAERKEFVGKYYYRAPGGESYPDVALRLHSFLGTLTRDFRQQSVLVVTHSVVVLLFRRLLERLSEQELLTIDADKAQEIHNCAISHYAFEQNNGTASKLVLKEFAGLHYSPELACSDYARQRVTTTQDCPLGR